MNEDERDEVNSRFREEAARYDLRFRCEDCDHFAPRTGRCSLEFLPGPLCTPDVRALDEDGEAVFCKYFELS